MKSAGLSSTHRNRLNKTNKMTAHANLQVGYLASKEKLKSLQLQAKQAQMDRLDRERQESATAPEKNDLA